MLYESDNRARSKLVFIGSRDWVFVLSLFEIVCTLHFIFSRLLAKSLIVLDTELAEKNVVKELGVYIEGQVFGYSFKPPKNYQPTLQTLWCTQNMQKIDCSSL